MTERGSILDQSIVLAFIRNSFRGLARPITRPGGVYNPIELDRGVDSDLTKKIVRWGTREASVKGQNLDALLSQPHLAGFEPGWV